MADLTVQLLPTRPRYPINDDEPKEYGEFNYIFYPGVSACQQIRITNNSGDAITPTIYFDRHESDEIWWKTLRISEDCTTALPSGVDDTQWTGEIAASGYQDLYIRSVCTKEGFSWKYSADYWTNSGFLVVDLNCINDNEELTTAVDCDAAAAGSYLTLDTQTVLPSGTCLEEEFVRVKFSVDAAVNATFDIQYSDNNTDWTTVYTGADLSIVDHRYQVTFWWDRAGAHRYWRVYKTNAAVAGGNITDIQWLLFEAHQDAYDFGVYGGHKATMKDDSGNMDDFEWRTNVMVNIDVFSRQNYLKPIGKVSTRTKEVSFNFEKNGQSVQLYYIPTMTFSYNLNIKSDFQLEKRIWDIKAFISPQKRELTYTSAADGLQPSLYRYDQRTIYMEPHGPDKVGWYMTNYDWWHAYGHSYYILFDNHCYKLDNPQPVYIDDELVAFTARMFLQSDMVNLSTDPRNYVLTNREGIFEQYPNGGYYLSVPTDWIDTNTPEQRPLLWLGANVGAIYSRPVGYSNRPDPQALAGVDSPDDGFPNGEMYITEDWNDPESANFQTSNPVAFGVRVDAGTGNAVYWQMPRFYNWIGYCDANGYYDVINCLVQVYMDEDCTIPVKLNLQSTQTLSKVEHRFNTAYTTAAGLVTLTALGGTITTDGHTTRTPSKLYVRYIPEDFQTEYYYPS